MNHIEGVTPILWVENPEASKCYYLNVLGFKLDWDVPWMCSVSRDKASVMLCQQHQGNPGTWLWFGCNDVDALHAEFVANGAMIRHPPTNFEWAYEFQVQDPDSHVLRFGGEPKQAPFGAFKP